MEHKVTLIKKGFYKEVSIEDGTSLLKCIQSYVSDFYAPCGGNGTCGKCRVNIKEEGGHVTSCLYPVESDITVFLPEKSEMKVLASQYELTKLVELRPGESVKLAISPYGVAIDIGTTTMVFYIVNLLLGSIADIVTMVNPQSRYGADVISRINYGHESPKHLANLQTPMIEAINAVIREYCKRTDVEINDFVKISVVGNTTMLHNLLGVDAITIALAPFTPKFTSAQLVESHMLGIDINPKGTVLLSPSLSGYVGADILAGLASIDATKLKDNFLFIDIGTNGEMILVTPEKTLACATAAGPAFEGANISCGMGAFSGAISEFHDGEMKVIDDVIPKGVCGSGLIDIVAFMLKASLLSPEGNISEEFLLYKADRQEENITLTQQDIREVQLAKAAVYAGIIRLLSIAGKSVDDLDHILLAGGFGNYLNISNAITIGLLPNLPLSKFIHIGNSAGSGAVLALKSEQFVEQIEKMKECVEYIELSTDSEFPLEFAMSMNFDLES